MPYDPNQIMGLDALSPTVAAYKQFVERQNNVGDPNVVQFLASRGEPQLAGLIAKKMRVENAAKAQQQLAQQPQAAPPTVAQQYDQAAQQQAQQAMAAQMAQMQQAQMAQAAPGLAGMPNAVMDRASFAGGGIVAFADGGDVQHFFVGGDTDDGMNDIPGYQQYMSGQFPGWNNMTDQQKQQVATAYSDLALRKRAHAIANVDMRPNLSLEQKEAEAYSKLKQGVQVGPSGTTQAAPAPTTQAIPSNVPTLAELQAKYARGQVPAPSSNRAVTKDSEKRGSAAPAAAGSQDLSNAIDIGEKPAAYASRPIDTTPYLNEQKFIENQIKTKGLSEKEARSNFWIMAGASLLGSRDPNFATALGAAVKENYGNLIGDLRNIKKENDALALQKIKLDQAIAVAQHTQDEKDRERADTLMNAYQNRVVMRDKAILDSRDKALDRASAERRTTEMYGNRADAAKTTARNNQLRTIITTAESELGRLPGVKYPALMTPEAKARAAELQSTIDRARRELMSGGEDDEESTGQSVTRTTKSGIPYIMEP